MITLNISSYQNDIITDKIFKTWLFIYVCMKKNNKILPLSILICFKTKISGEFTKALLDFTNQSNFPPSKKKANNK